MTSQQRKCLNENELELFILQNDIWKIGDKSEILNHISSCRFCRRRYFELQMFHQILNFELSKPISKEIHTLVKGITE